MRYYQLDVTFELNTNFNIISDDQDPSDVIQATSNVMVNVGRVSEPERLLERLRMVIEQEIGIVKEEERARGTA